MKYPHIFSPITVKSMTLRNRTAMTAIGTNFAKQNGEMSEKHKHYYEMRARGGTGLLIVENICVDFPLGSNGTTQLRIDHDSYIPGLAELCEAVHAQGACIAVQINHAGASAMSSRTGMQPVSASDIPSKEGGELPRPLEKWEIEEIARKYGDAARRAKIAGFDAVEIHGGHSYLISQFMSPTTNRRTDEYGGSGENRVRFAALVLSEVRKAVGESYPIIMRVSAEELCEGGNTLEDTMNMLEHIQQDVDIFDVSAGLNSSIQYQIDATHLPDGWRSYMAAAVGKRFNKPVLTMGNIRDPQAAEDILAEGDADLIGLGRALIADSDWANKAQFGGDIRKCISCNIGCAGHRIGLNKPIRCTINPTVNSGEEYARRKVTRHCNVVVIGGGTAGLEAACTAAEVGCEVFLLEQKPQLGGLAAEISKIPKKNRLADFPRWLIRRSSALKNLHIFTDTPAALPIISSMNPDIIVNATGSLPLLPPIPGLKENLEAAHGRVRTIQTFIDCLEEYPRDMNGQKIVVIGGGAVGIDVAEFFADRNTAVTIVEMMPEIGRDLDPVSKSGLKEMVKTHGVDVRVNTKLLLVYADSFLVEYGGEKTELPFDHGFVCLGMKAHAPVMQQLLESYADIPVINIGDSARARRIIEGVAEGHNILTVLEQRGYFG